MTNAKTNDVEDAPGVAAQYPLLYHYTREYAFRAIIKTNTLWATYFEDLNDATEFRHIREPLAAEMGDRFIPLAEAFARRGDREAELVRRQGGPVLSARRIGKRLMEILYQVTFGAPPGERLHECFVSSFCSHGAASYEERNGLLSQWRGYGGDGGFCLVFDTKRLEALLEEERQAYEYVFLRLASAHYFKDRKSMPGHFAELVTASAQALELALAGSDFSPEAMLDPFLLTAATTKHRGFEEEREVRLVAMPLTLLGHEKMRGTSGYQPMPVKTSFACTINAKTKRHIRLFAAERSPLPLVRVLIGPARDQTRNAEIARGIVGKGIEIVCSETPLVI